MPAGVRLEQSAKLMSEYWQSTNGRPESRYLWNDAFAVCVMLHFDRLGVASNFRWKDAAQRLVEQVHDTLGRFRADDSDQSRRNRFLSGLDQDQAQLHPTAGGLRIGKRLPGRKAFEKYDSVLEWERDGQYFHYLTKWISCLCQFQDQTKCRWAVELAKAIFPKFYRGGRGIFWKMSEDLRYPVVSGHGAHDALDGFITFRYLDAIAPHLDRFDSEVSCFLKLVNFPGLVTSDTLGIGGLLQDSFRLAQIIRKDSCEDLPNLTRFLICLLEVSLQSLNQVHWYSFDAVEEYRLAFRELGLSIGLAAILFLGKEVDNLNLREDEGKRVADLVDALSAFLPWREKIINFWSNPLHQVNKTWKEHQGINTVMLAASLVPESVLHLQFTCNP